MQYFKQVSVAATAIVVGGALLTGVAIAQPAAKDAEPGRPEPGRYGWGPGMMMGPGMMAGQSFGFMCNPRSAGMAEWRMKRIETEIKPTDAQKVALEALRAASTKAAESIAAACATSMPTKSTERMALMEKRMDALLQAIKTVRPAFENFYGTLDDSQKARLDRSGPQRWGWGDWRWPWRMR
jgi:hypothetical protein